MKNNKFLISVQEEKILNNLKFDNQISTE